MKPLDPRLLRYSAAARGYLAVSVALGLAATALILLQAGLLAYVLDAAATGTGVRLLAGPLATLAIVLLARAAAGYGGGGHRAARRGRGQVPAAPPADGSRPEAGAFLALPITGRAPVR